MSVLTQSETLTWTGAGGAPLAGTFSRPAGAGRAPALLLIQGSGPTDRDGNQRPHMVSDLLKDTADLLAGLGVATLRYDKRGLGAVSGTLPTDPQMLLEFVRWEHFVGDAEAAFGVLRAHDGVDAGRVGLLGHSEGGLIALDLAAAGRVEPAALVLAATPGRPVAALLRDQLGRMARGQGAPQSVIAAILDDNDRIIAHLIETGQYPAQIHPGLAALYPAYLRLFWRSMAALDPVALALRCRGPVLVIGGEQDVQVSPERDLAALADGLGRRTRPDASHRLVILPGASHNLKPVAGDEPGVTGPPHEGYAASLAGWLAQIGWI